MHEIDAYHPSELAQSFLTAMESLENNPLASLEDQGRALQTIHSIGSFASAYGKHETPVSRDLHQIITENDPLPTLTVKVAARCRRAIDENAWPMSELGKAEVSY